MIKGIAHPFSYRKEDVGGNISRMFPLNVFRYVNISKKV